MRRVSEEKATGDGTGRFVDRDSGERDVYSAIDTTNH